MNLTRWRRRFAGALAFAAVGFAASLVVAGIEWAIAHLSHVQAHGGNHLDPVVTALVVGVGAVAGFIQAGRSEDPRGRPMEPPPGVDRSDIDIARSLDRASKASRAPKHKKKRRR